MAGTGINNEEAHTVRAYFKGKVMLSNMQYVKRTRLFLPNAPKK
tara:strand:+ start:697 stop:828 length:132 start_codon:yes stop_codon:yes gene_type:complete